MKTIVARARFDEPVTDTVVAARTTPREQKGIQASSVQYFKPMKGLLVQFADSAIVLPVNGHPELRDLPEEALSRVALGFNGTALVLDEYDLHISLAGMLQHNAAIERIARFVVSSKNGQAKSRIKTIAARENGAKGGRPVKKIAAAG